MASGFARPVVTWIAFIFISAANGQQNQDLNAKEKCEAIIRAHGFLSRAQFQCGYHHYSDKMFQSVRSCTSGKTEEQVMSLLRRGMETFDRNERESSHDAICQDILIKFEGIVGRSKYYELEKLETGIMELRSEGRFREAKAAAVKLRARAEQLVGKNHDAYANSLQALGVTQLDLGEAAEAFESFRDALPVAEAVWGSSSPVVGELLNNMGEALRRRGQYEAAEQMFRRSVEVHKANEGVESERYAESEVNLAIVLPEEKSVEAESMLWHAYKVFKAINGEKDSRLGVVLMNVAFRQRRQGKLAECEQTLKAALNQMGTDRIARADAVNALADVLFRERKFKESKIYYEQVTDIYRDLFGERHYKLATAYSRLANIAFASIFENPKRMFELMRNGLALRRKAYESTKGYEHVVPRGRISDTGVEGEEDVRTVQLAYLFALDTAKKARLETEGNLDRESFLIGQVLQESSVGDVFKLMAGRLATGSSEQALTLRKLQDTILKRRAVEVASIQELQNGNFASLASIKEQLAALDREIQGYSSNIDAKFPQYAGLIDSKPLPVEEVQSYLANDEALISILAENSHLNIWVVTKSDLRWVASIEKTNIEKSSGIPEKLGTSADVERLRRDVSILRCGLEFEAWQRDGSGCSKLLNMPYTLADYATGKPIPFSVDAAYDLYQLLFKEVADLLVGKRLMVVTSDVLSGIPFQVLVSAPSTDKDFRSVEWLARNHAISVLPSVSALKALRSVARPSRAASPIIGFGNPLLDGHYEGEAIEDDIAERVRLAKAWQSCDVFASTLHDAKRDVRTLDRQVSGGAMRLRKGVGQLQQLKAQIPLPETAYELCEVVRILQADPREVRLGSKATKTEVKALNQGGRLANYRVVHFATHGVIAGELIGATEPGLILTPPTASNVDDDGFLTASEIASLKLDADWVILSACNTAAGEHDNAGALSGLARAFFYAGARSVLVTHWAINSDAAVELITTSIKELSTDAGGRDEALRRAMMKMVANGGKTAHPSFWGPFSLVGDTVVRQ